MDLIKALDYKFMWYIAYSYVHGYIKKCLYSIINDKEISLNI